MQWERNLPFHRHFVDWRFLADSIQLSGMPCLRASAITAGSCGSKNNPTALDTNLASLATEAAASILSASYKHAEVTNTAYTSFRAHGWLACFNTWEAERAFLGFA